MKTVIKVLFIVAMFGCEKDRDVKCLYPFVYSNYNDRDILVPKCFIIDSDTFRATLLHYNYVVDSFNHCQPNRQVLTCD